MMAFCLSVVRCRDGLPIIARGRLHDVESAPSVTQVEDQSGVDYDILLEKTSL